MTNLVNGTAQTRSVAVMAAFLAGLAAAIVIGWTFVNSLKEKDRMGKTENGPVSRVAIPPIDTAAPANTETATFALG